MAQLTGLNNKVAVITGGSQGLGAATAHLFAERGAKGLVLCGRQTAKGLAVAESIQSRYPACKVHFVTADLAEIDAPQHIIMLHKSILVNSTFSSMWQAYLSVVPF